MATSTPTSPVPPYQNHAPLNILTFDGGGVRTLISLIILREIMSTLRKRLNTTMGTNLEADEMKPCDIFDLVAGSSNGGLIALMLGRFRLGVFQCIKEYRTLASEVYGDPLAVQRRHDPEWLKQGKSIYSSEKLVTEVKKLVVAYGGTQSDGNIAERFEDPRGQNACKTLVLAIYGISWGHNTPPIRLRSYVALHGDTHEHYIWEVARASIAAKPFFDVLRIDDGIMPHMMMDAELGFNNPTKEAIYEAQEIWPTNSFERHKGRKLGRPLGCILSLGSGLLDVVGLAGGPTELQKAYKKMLSDCGKVTNEVRREYPNGEDSPYFRFNIDSVLDEIPEDEWSDETMKVLTEVTLEWMHNQDIKTRVERCVEALFPRVCAVYAPNVKTEQVAM